ncbi:hypothetical protein N9L68_04765 [bacterium]|nr:hypothetical protein [bacterium]
MFVGKPRENQRQLEATRAEAADLCKRQTEEEVAVADKFAAMEKAKIEVREAVASWVPAAANGVDGANRRWRSYNCHSVDCRWKMWCV